MSEVKLTPKDAFLDTYRKYNVGNDNLLRYLGDDLFTAPASHMTSMNNAFEGGLLNHMFRVVKHARNINNGLQEALRLPLDTIIKVCFLCEIGRVGMYTPQEDKWQREKLGKVYEFKDDAVSMYVGQRSVYILTITGNSLSEVQYQAILTHDANVSDSPMLKWHADPLTIILRQAIELAILEEKFDAKKNG